VAVVFALQAVAVAAEGREAVTLYYWGNEMDLLALDMLRDFENLYNGEGGRPHIKVVSGQSASINKTTDPQRLLCAVVGGDPPDVVMFDRFAVPEWAARGAFLSLQTYLERDLRERPRDPDTLHPEDFFEPCWKESNYNGELFGVPSDTDNRAFYYNLDLLEKYSGELIAAGCTDPLDSGKVGPPRTWEQLKRATEIMTEFGPDGKLKQVGFIPNFGNSWLYIYGWLNGGTFMSADGRTCTMNCQENVEALAYMTEMYDLLGGAEAAMAFQSSLQTGDLDPFIAGKVAMKIDGDWFLLNIANSKRNFRFGVVPAPAPEGKPRFGWCGGFANVIPASAQHPDEAWLFVKYLVSQRAYKIRNDAEAEAVHAAGNVFIPRMSSRKDITDWGMEYYVYRDPQVEDTFKNAMRVFVGILPECKYRPVTQVGQLLWNEHERAMWEGIYKRSDARDIHRNAQAVLDRGTRTVQKELDRIYHPVDYPVLRWGPILTAYVLLIAVACVGLYVYFNRRVTARGYFRREFYAGYLFASPWFIGFLVFGGGPLLFSLFMSFCEYDVLSPPKFVGMQNYAFMVQDPLFYKSLWNTVYMAMGIPLGMIISLGVALLLNYEVRGMTVYRTFFYLPAIMPAVAASILWIWIFNPNEGILNAALAKCGVSGPAWLQNEYWSKPALILMGLWSSGAGMIVWLAGLKGIPQHLYEAAELDGAGPIRKFFSITLPMLSPYILFNMVMGLIGTFQIFTQAYVMTQGGPVDSTLFYAYYLFNNAFRFMRMGYASALAWVLFGIVLALTVLQLQLSRRWVYYESEK
jgi:multiple sugar transport system permease protein